MPNGMMKFGKKESPTANEETSHFMMNRFMSKQIMRKRYPLHRIFLFYLIMTALLFSTSTVLAASDTEIGYLDLNSGRDLSGKGYY